MILMLALAATLQAAPEPGLLHRLEVAPGETLAVHRWGEGEPLVLVPGLLGSAFGFRKLVEPLVSAGHEVIIIDPLGTGSSNSPKNADYSLAAQAERVGTAARTVGVRRAVFACHAMGAPICFRLALRDPVLVAGIVSINGGPAEHAKTPGLGLALKLAPLIKLIGGTGIARGKVKNGLQDSSADPAWVTQDVVEGYTAHYRHGVGPVLDVLKRIANAEEPDSLGPALPGLTTPVCLLIGDGAETGRIDPREIKALLTVPQLDIDTVATSGQYIHEEQPQIVIDAIRDMRAWTNAGDPLDLGIAARSLARASRTGAGLTALSGDRRAEDQMCNASVTSPRER